MISLKSLAHRFRLAPVDQRQSLTPQRFTSLGIAALLGMMTVISPLRDIRPAFATEAAPVEPVTDPIPAIEPSSEPTPAPTFRRKVETRIQLDLSDRRLSLYADDQLVGSYTVAVGKPGWETPIGDYSILHMAIDPIWENPWTGELIYPGPTNPMGRAVIVFHTVGDDMIAFHGTPDEGLLGQAVSHGCVRMLNADVAALFERVQVGTPVIVEP